MRRDSIERTGRLGDFQCRFLSGSLFSKMGWTRGKRPDGSVYSTTNIRQSVNDLVDSGMRAIFFYLPVTLLEPACGDVSIFPELYRRRRGKEQATLQKGIPFNTKQGLFP